MRRRADGRRVLRLVGAALIITGASAIIWAIVVWQWQDPFTNVYTAYQQHKLASRYKKRLATYRLPVLHATATAKPSVAVEERDIALAARRYRATLTPGEPVGRIKVHRLGLNAILVAGTDHDSLTKGPGWDRSTFLPGESQLVYIAGHRTTYSAPFAHIDSFRPGDLVTIEVPYGTFTYAVRSHRVVPADDLSQLESHGREVVALQACHPRFFATHRYIAYAVPVRVVPRRGRPYTFGSGRVARAAPPTNRGRAAPAR